MKFRMMQKLVRALRSGKYEQTQSRLRGEGIDKRYAYCCLGVACRIAGVAFDTDHAIKGTVERNYLNQKAANYFGFSTNRGMLMDGRKIKVGGKFHGSLAIANDDGRTFDEIADAIKANWRDL